MSPPKETTALDANAPPFRPKRKAAGAVRELVAKIAAEEQEDEKYF